MRIALLFLLALCAGCTPEYIKPTWYETAAIVEYKDAASPVGEGFAVPIRLTREQAHKWVDDTFDKQGYIRYGLITAPAPQYNGDCRMTVIGHEFTHIVRGLFHSKDARMRCR